MLFNSLDFLLFFPVVCIIYYAVSSLKWRNLFLLVASYYFYMNWEPVYALLLLASTGITYLASFGIDRYENKKKTILSISIIANLAILFFFKYFNWAADNITALMDLAGISIHIPEFKVLLPVGISFYIFQALGYSIDVYRKTIAPEKNFFRYALFVSFFPQLVAGPIERSTGLLPQFQEKKKFSYDNLMKGLNMMLWGYFLKLVVADRIAVYVNSIFNNVAMHNGGSSLLASLLFPFQLYGDFAGYSLIAIGAAKVMGFTLMQNFRQPYFFSTSIQDYWKRNHISLTTWFMDYIYYSMVGSSTKLWWWCFSIWFTFFISGFWHGANWTYVLCFSLFGLGLVYGLLTQKKKKKWEKKHHLKNNALYHGVQRFTTFIVLAFILIFFRANTLEDAFSVISKIFTDIAAPYKGLRVTEWVLIFLSLAILFVKEFIDEFGLKLHLSQSRYWIVRHGYVLAMIFFIILFGKLNGSQFIYFQF